MVDSGCATDYDGAMRSSANALTRKLHATVMDVFGNYAASDEDDYKNMIALVDKLRNKQVKDKQQDPPTTKSGNNTRGVIAKKLLEGYVLHGDVCDKCVMPLMAYNGHVSCVVCKKVDELSKTNDAMVSKLSSSTELTLTSTAESELSEYERENLVNKELSHFNERRTQATNAYAAKMLAGYTMQDQLCSMCDMPMMRYKDSVECVVCPKHAEKEKLVPVMNEKEIAADGGTSNMIAIIKPSELQKPVKQLSQAELLVERLRSKKSNSCPEKTESEIEKAERELLEMIGSQNGEIGEALQCYFSERKAERAAQKTISELENLVIEAEADAIAASGEEEHVMQVPTHTEPVVAAIIAESNSLIAPVAVATPRFEPSVACNIGDDLTAHPVAIATPRFEPSKSCNIGDSISGLKSMFASASDPTAMDNEIIASAANPSEGHFAAKEMCGLVVENQASGNAHTCKQVQEDITQQMVNRIAQGWIIVPGSQCPASTCRMPIMLNPHTRQAHCLACEALPEPESKTTSLPVSKNSENPYKEDMQSILKVDLVAEPTYTSLPDPTTSMYELRGLYGGKPVDPTPSIQTLKDRLNIATNAGHSKYITGEPTPAAKTVHYRMGDPTPNMQSVRFKLNEATHNTQAVRKMMEP